MTNQAERLQAARALLQRSTDASGAQSPASNYPVPAVLRDLLPLGVRRGAVGVVQGSSALLLSMLGEMSRHEAWIALVGFPTLGLLAAQQQGVDLSRVVVVPKPEDQAANVIASLMDGIDVVVCGTAAVLSGSERRRLTNRARERKTVLLTTEPWPGADLDLGISERRWTGLEQGSGQLEELHLVISRRDHGYTHSLEVAQWARVAN